LAKTFSKAAGVRRAVLLAAVSVSFAGCTELDNAIASVPYLAMMRNAPFFDPYEAPLPAPAGAIPFDGPQGAGIYLPPQEPSEPALNAFAATAAGRNPYNHDDKAVLAHGQKMFERHCAVCHGKDAKGNGSVIGAGKFPMNPPDLTKSGRAEGYVYAIIRSGRGLMPSYGARTSDLDRWAIASYVAQLQGLAGGTPATTTNPDVGPPGNAAPSGSTPGAAPATTTTSQAPAPAGQENR
jgi:mono/diheme cytochrome c family protein